MVIQIRYNIFQQISDRFFTVFKIYKWENGELRPYSKRKGLQEVRRHDSFTLDSLADVVQGGSHDVDDQAVAFDLELVEDVERLFEPRELAQGVVEHVAFPHEALLRPDHVDLELVLLHFVGDDQAADDLLRRRTRGPAGLLRLHVDPGLDKAVNLDQAAVEVGE